MCPHCHADNSAVVETRRDGGSVYRRRRCREPECTKTFISVESAPTGMKFPKIVREESLRRLHAACGAPATSPINNDVFSVWN